MANAMCSKTNTDSLQMGSTLTMHLIAHDLVRRYGSQAGRVCVDHGGGGGSSKVTVAYSRHSGSIQCLEQAKLVATRTTC